MSWIYLKSSSLFSYTVFSVIGKKTLNFQEPYIWAFFLNILFLPLSPHSLLEMYINENSHFLE